MNCVASGISVCDMSRKGKVKKKKEKEKPRIS